MPGHSSRPPADLAVGPGAHARGGDLAACTAPLLQKVGEDLELKAVLEAYRIASGWADIMSNEAIFHQVAQLRMCRCKMAVNQRHAGRVDRCPAIASVPGLSHLLPWHACGGPPPSGWQFLVDLVRRSSQAAAVLRAR